MSNGWVTRPRAIKAKVVPSPPPAGVSGKEGCPLVSVVGRTWLVQGSERELAGAAAGMGEGEGRLTERETRCGHGGPGDGSFQSAFSRPHRGSCLQGQAGPAVCRSGGT